MKSHQLADLLLRLPDTELTASIDTGNEKDPGERFFGEGLYSMQGEPDQSITLLFESGHMNVQKRT